jgi:hypothetical protein
MDLSIPESSPLPGHTTLVIPFPPAGPWQTEGQSRDIGAFKSGLCSGNLFKTADNCLYIFLEVLTWKNRFIKTYIPLRLPDEGESMLHIHWREAGVRLQQDAHPAIEVDWQRRS